jgi:hypothetical protein
VILSVFILNFLIAENILSQSSYTSHAFQRQFEILGPGASSSLTIDSRLTKKENGIGFRAEIGITPLGWAKDACNSGSLNSFPIGMNYLIGHGKHLFEVAGGGVLLFTSETKVFVRAWRKVF